MIRVGSFLVGAALVNSVATLAVADDIPGAATPGLIAGTDPAEVCGYLNGLSYSKQHRQTTAEMKRSVGSHCGEVDHRVPLALGGADDVRNLWCQPGEGKWTYREKDKLEVYVWHSVCRARSMSLTEGQAVFLAPDWRTEYCRLIGGAPCSGER